MDDDFSMVVCPPGDGPFVAGAEVDWAAAGEAKRTMAAKRINACLIELLRGSIAPDPQDFIGTMVPGAFSGEAESPRRKELLQIQRIAPGSSLGIMCDILVRRFGDVLLRRR